jgi:hypothetical protein
MQAILHEKLKQQMVVEQSEKYISHSSPLII